MSKSVFLGLVLCLAASMACSQAPSVSCSSEEVKALVADISLGEAARQLSQQMLGPYHGQESIRKIRDELNAKRGCQ